MNRKGFIKIGLPVLMCSLIATGAAGLSSLNVFAANSKTKSVQEVKTQAPDYKASIQLNSQEAKDTENENKVDESESDSALLSKATITKEQAISAATAVYPRYTAKDANIGDENGNLVYDINMFDVNNKSIDVKVAAGNAKILAADTDSEEIANSNEKEYLKSGVDNDNINEQVEE